MHQLSSLTCAVASPPLARSERAWRDREQEKDKGGMHTRERERERETARRRVGGMRIRVERR